MGGILSGVEKEDLQEQNKTMLKEIKALQSTLEEQYEQLATMKEYQSESDETISKLHKRCAKLVASKGEKGRELDNERAEMVQQVTKFREQVMTGLEQRDVLLKKQDGLLGKLNGELTSVQQQLKTVQREKEESLAARDAYWAEKVASSSSSSGNGSSKGDIERENDELRDKIMDLEERLYNNSKKEKEGGERQSKERRALRDRSINPNTSSSSSTSLIPGAGGGKPSTKSFLVHRSEGAENERGTGLNALPIDDLTLGTRGASGLSRRGL